MRSGIAPEPWHRNGGAHGVRLAALKLYDAMAVKRSTADPGGSELVMGVTPHSSVIPHRALGRELATTYSNAEMLAMFKIHVQEDVLDKDTAVAMTGAIKYKDMTVSEVMTPLKNTFMLSVDEKLNFETIATIFKTGYSRIPIFEVSQNNIIGLLFVKDLIFIDPPYSEIESRIDLIFAKANQHAIQEAAVILEFPGNVRPEPENWRMVRRFGKSKRDAPNAAIFERS